MRGIATVENIVTLGRSAKLFPISASFHPKSLSAGIVDHHLVIILSHTVMPVFNAAEASVVGELARMHGIHPHVGLPRSFELVVLLVPQVLGGLLPDDLHQSLPLLWAQVLPKI